MQRKTDQLKRLESLEIIQEVMGRCFSAFWLRSNKEVMGRISRNVVYKNSIPNHDRK